MAGITVNVAGTDAIFHAMDELIQRNHTQLQAAVERATLACYAGALDRVPVATGALRDSAYEQVDDLMGTVGFGTDHCLYVELGTSRMAAQPYLVPAFVEAKVKFLDDCQTIVRNP